jgi:hypothetical protein
MNGNIVKPIAPPTARTLNVYYYDSFPKLFFRIGGRPARIVWNDDNTITAQYSAKSGETREIFRKSVESIELFGYQGARVNGFSITFNDERKFRWQALGWNPVRGSSYAFSYTGDMLGRRIVLGGAVQWAAINMSDEAVNAREQVKVWKEHLGGSGINTEIIKKNRLPMLISVSIVAFVVLFAIFVIVMGFIQQK